MSIQPKTKTKSRRTAVLFDLDGTLADTGPDLVAALNAMRAERGLAPVPMAAAAADVGYGSRQLMTKHLITGAEDLTPLRAQFLQEYDRTGHKQTKLFVGISELLDYLEQNEIPWAIVTNKPTAQTHGLLPVIGLANRAVAVICSDTLIRYKPHPDGLLHVCDMLNLAPQDCFFVGDNILDLQAAAACAMPFIAAGWGYWPTDQDGEYVLADPRELIGLLT